MKLSNIKSKFLIILFLFFGFVGFAKEYSEGDHDQQDFDPKEMILHHVKDAYGMHIATLNAQDEHPIHLSIPLPVIVYSLSLIHI